jgi:hypothetical protein
MLDLLSSLGKRTIYVSLDGPKSEEVSEAQSALLEAIRLRNIGTDSPIKVRRNRTNQGVAVSVITGIDWFFSNETFGIILEDDLYFTSDFLNWCEWANKAFSEDSQIFMISGNRFDEGKRISYTHYPQTWGWATWQNRWLEIRPFFEGSGFNFKNLFSYKSNFWTGGTLRILATVTDTWDIAVAKYMRENKLLSVLPPANLVSNLGADQFSTHTTLNKFPIGYPIQNLLELPAMKAAQTLSEISSNDAFLETKVFAIKPKHWFSLVKNLHLYFFRSRLRRKLLSNKSTLYF